VAAAIAPRPLTLSGTVNPLREALSPDEVRAAYRRTAAVYERLAASEALRIR
jgi:hypothetical protein